MVYVIILAVVFFIIEYRDTGFVSEGFFGILKGAFFGLLVWLTIGSVIGYMLPSDITYEETKIYALKDSSETSGAIFLASGYSDEKLVYRYIVMTDKGKQIKTISAKNAYIEEIKDGEPVVRKYSYKLKKGQWWFATSSFNFLKNYAVFYVPEGTVTGDFNVNLE